MVCTVASVPAIAGITVSPAATDTAIKFCVNKKTSAVTQRVKCTSSERSVTVNQTGPAGPSSLPRVYRGNSLDSVRAVGIPVPDDAWKPITIWQFPEVGRFMVNQTFTVNAFPTQPGTQIVVECEIGDLGGYYSATTILATPNPHAPEGVTNFNTGFGSVTYVSNGEALYLPKCRNLSAEASVYVATWPASVIPVGLVSDLPANRD